MCEGAGCDACDAGTVSIASCPKASLTIGVCHAIRIERMMENGVLPVAGGWLDQTNIGMDAVQFIANERSHWEEYLIEKSKKAHGTTKH